MLKRKASVARTSAFVAAVTAVGCTSFGCTFDTSGAVDETDDGDSAGSDTSTTSGPTVGNTTYPDASSPARTTTSGSNRVAALALDVPELADLALGEARRESLTATNTGAALASITRVEVSSPFHIASTDCEARSLAPGANCSISVGLSGDTLGPAAAELRVSFDNGTEKTQAVKLLQTEVVGETPNLISDPGFEHCELGDPPGNGWSNNYAGVWECTAGTVGFRPHSGTQMLRAPVSKDNTAESFAVSRIVDLSAFGPAIETGAMEFRFSGHVRTRGGDEIRVLVRYRDADGSGIVRYNSGSERSAPDWFDLHDARAVPPETRSARITLQCHKSNGLPCEAYYDDLVLIGAYHGS